MHTMNDFIYQDYINVAGAQTLFEPSPGFSLREGALR